MMIKPLCISLLTLLLFSACKSTTTRGGGSSSNPKSGNPTKYIDSTKPLTIDDNTVKINPNNTINEEFGNGLLPNEFVNGEKISHNFQATYFAYDSANINPQDMPKLRMLAGFLESNPNLYLIIQGHSDERGSAEYNRALSERRALAVKGTLEENAPSINQRINTIGFGEEKLADSGTTADAHAKNRRAVFVIISKR